LREAVVLKNGLKYAFTITFSFSAFNQYSQKSPPFPI
jgi:hypothetical protein